MCMGDVDDMSYYKTAAVRDIFDSLFKFESFRENLQCSSLQILKSSQKKTDAGGIFNRFRMKNVQTRSVQCAQRILS